MANKLAHNSVCSVQDSTNSKRMSDYDKDTHCHHTIVNHLNDVVCINKRLFNKCWGWWSRLVDYLFFLFELGWFQFVHDSIDELLEIVIIEGFVLVNIGMYVKGAEKGNYCTVIAVVYSVVFFEQ